MGVTKVTGYEVDDDTIMRNNLNTSSSGYAVVAKLVAGDDINLVSSGTDPGTGDVTIHATGVFFEPGDTGTRPVKRKVSGHIVNGDYSGILTGKSCTVSGDYSSVVGGYTNAVNADYSFIGGGLFNTIIGNQSVICGGLQCSASGNFSVVGGGRNNSATAPYGSVLGGYSNEASGNYGSVVGGRLNQAGGNESFVGGGYSNDANSDFSFTSGGKGNSVEGNYSGISGGYYNTTKQSPYCFIGGGMNNYINPSPQILAPYNSILGGRDNIIGGSLLEPPRSCVIVGGRDNNITRSSYGFIGSGYGCSILPSGGTSYAAIISGKDNTVKGDYSVVINGKDNEIDDGVTMALVHGDNILARSRGQFSLSSGRFDDTFDAQSSIYMLRRVTDSSDTSAVPMYLDWEGIEGLSGTGTGSEEIPVEQEGAYLIQVYTVGRFHYYGPGPSLDDLAFAFSLDCVLLNDGTSFKINNSSLFPVIVPAIYAASGYTCGLTVAGSAGLEKLRVQVDGNSVDRVFWLSKVTITHVSDKP